MKAEKPPAPAQPAAGRSSPTVTPAGKPPATTRRKQSPTVTPTELVEADRYLSGLWNNPSAGWRNRLQRMRVQTRKNWVNS